MEIILVVLLGVLIVFSLAFVAGTTRRRERRRGVARPPARPAEAARPTTTTAEAPPVEKPSRPAAPAEVEEQVSQEPAGPPDVEQAAVAPAPAPEPTPEPEPEPPKFRDRLSKARGALAGYFGAVVGREKLDEDVWDELEEALIRADVGISTTTSLLDGLRTKVKESKLSTPQQVVDALKQDLKDRFAGRDRTLQITDKPTVWLFVGVNGVGKTTTIGKVGQRQAQEGRKVVMAAGDTFRAAAAEQLELWAKRVGAELVRGAEGGDPASVIFDAAQKAASQGADLVLADTAGRLQNKVNLMEELRKVRRVAERPPGNLAEVLLVIDAGTGQNGLAQAREFTDVAGVTGVVLTKMDTSAKGGIAVAVESELDIPVKLIGLGETAADLVDFDPNEYVDALF
ncbi:MAG TPA: signal recognition particle-docking protein FtsY [Acidimicrobiales bacterium]|nr:signal recognition particle-docking protein FtsY [Acidimicrobiales bacterium]